MDAIIEQKINKLQNQKIQLEDAIKMLQHLQEQVTSELMEAINRKD